MSLISSNFLYNSTKAGLTAPIDQVVSKIKEITKNSKFNNLQEKRSERVRKIVKGLNEALKKATKHDLSVANQQASSYIAKMEKQLDFTRIFLHADLDAFYASVESLIDKSLIGKPYAVGGSSGRGVISASSYEARKFGVRSGMATFVAVKLCPKLIIVEPHYDKYVYYSDIVRNIFHNYDPNFVSFGLDEATLEVTDYIHLNNIDCIELAQKIKSEVFQATNLTISVGIAHSSLLSKVASDINKPDGIFKVPSNKEDLEKFLKGLNIRKIPGVGSYFEEVMKGIGVVTIKDLFEKKDIVWLLMSKISCKFIFRAAVGAHKEISVRTKSLSISKQRTFEETDNMSALVTMIETLSSKVGNEMKKQGVMFKTVTVRFKDEFFNTSQKCISLDKHSDRTEDILATSLRLLREERSERKIKLRLLGVCISNFLYSGELKQLDITVFRTDKNEISNTEGKSKSVLPDEIFEDDNAVYHHLDEVDKNEVLKKDSEPEKHDTISYYFTKMRDDADKRDRRKIFISLMDIDSRPRRKLQTKALIKQTFSKKNGQKLILDYGN